MKTAVSATLLSLALLAGCSPAPADSPEAVAELDTETAAAETPAPVSALEAAIASDVRSPEEKARDVWRHPKETLEFLGVEPDDTVVEIWPGGGWYTNILAPYLASGGGKLVAVLFSPEGIDDAERVARIETNNENFKSNYTDPKFGTITYSGFSANSGPLTEPGTADVVLTFRNIHNWMAGGYEQKFFDDAYTALKPGGILGVVEHRLPSTAVQDPKAPAAMSTKTMCARWRPMPVSSSTDLPRSMQIRLTPQTILTVSGRCRRSATSRRKAKKPPKAGTRKPTRPSAKVTA
jgi:predicted methyltransferase